MMTMKTLRNIKDNWNKIKKSCLKVFVDMVKIREVSCTDSIIFLTVYFFQIYGTILEKNSHLNWNDEIIGSFVYKFFGIIRVVPYFINEEVLSVYWTIYGLGSFMI